MDILPENLNPSIIEIAKRNPMVKELVTVYLHELPMREGRALTWMETLEMIVLKLDEQYVGMSEAAKRPQKGNPKDLTVALVNEKEKPCPECKSLTWFIDTKDGARKGRRNVV